MAGGGAINSINSINFSREVYNMMNGMGINGIFREIGAFKDSMSEDGIYCPTVPLISKINVTGSKEMLTGWPVKLFARKSNRVPIAPYGTAFSDGNPYDERVWKTVKLGGYQYKDGKPIPDDFDQLQESSPEWKAQVKSMAEKIATAAEERMMVRLAMRPGHADLNRYQYFLTGEEYNGTTANKKVNSWTWEEANDVFSEEPDLGKPYPTRHICPAWNNGNYNAYAPGTAPDYSAITSADVFGPDILRKLHKWGALRLALKNDRVDGFTLKAPMQMKKVMTTSGSEMVQEVSGNVLLLMTTEQFADLKDKMGDKLTAKSEELERDVWSWGDFYIIIADKLPRFYGGSDGNVTCARAVAIFADGLAHLTGSLEIPQEHRAFFKEKAEIPQDAAGNMGYGPVRCWTHPTNRGASALYWQVIDDWFVKRFPGPDGHEVPQGIVHIDTAYTSADGHENVYSPGV